ncbi:Stk1 family PASTA domain-containing Ser/Thr kinase [soil metagenome]
MTQPPLGPPSGDEPIRLGGRYEIGGLLGRGGMADVRVGRDLRLGRTVAVKLLRADLASDPTFHERFRREAQAAASLNHPSIVAVYDTGESPGVDGQAVPYIVMEYVEGQTLRDVLRDGRKILPERALDVTADILSALGYSHRAGIVHRDIKPANVMLSQEGKVKVMDFGIARAIADSSTAMTQTAAVIGTAQYLSPEQARGETVDARSDIYSTGCVLYELLTGRPPFVGDSPVSVAYQHVREEARPPSQLNPDVSASVDAVVAKALAKRTEDRYQSAEEMRKDIQRVVAGHHIDAPTVAAPVAPGLAAAAVAPTQTAAAASGATPPGGRRIARDENDDNGSKKLIWAGVIGLIALIALGFGFYQLTKGDPEVAKVAVPSVVGSTEESARVTLTGAGFTVGEVSPSPSAEVDKGSVISQLPGADEKAAPGSAIDLVVSSGPEAVTMPNLVSKTYKEAKAQLEALSEENNLGIRIEQEVEDQSDRPKNEVTKTNPVFSEMIEPGSTVTIFVSPGSTTVPDVRGLTEADARAAIADANLKVNVDQATSASVPAGTVISQNPTGGSVSPGSTVTIVVSTGPPPTPTPTTPTLPTDPPEEGD